MTYECITYVWASIYVCTHGSTRPPPRASMSTKCLHPSLVQTWHIPSCSYRGDLESYVRLGGENMSAEIP